MRTTTNLSKNGTLFSGYDYKNQSWVLNGVYVRCGHPEAGDRYIDDDRQLHIFAGCSCYGTLHEGEACAEQDLS